MGISIKDTTALMLPALLVALPAQGGIQCDGLFHPHLPCNRVEAGKQHGQSGLSTIEGIFDCHPAYSSLQLLLLTTRR